MIGNFMINGILKELESRKDESSKALILDTALKARLYPKHTFEGKLMKVSKTAISLNEALNLCDNKETLLTNSLKSLRSLNLSTKEILERYSNY